MRRARSPFSTYQALAVPSQQAITTGERSPGLTPTGWAVTVSFAMRGVRSPVSTHQALRAPSRRASTRLERSLGLTSPVALFMVSFAMPTRLYRHRCAQSDRRHDESADGGYHLPDFERYFSNPTGCAKSQRWELNLTSNRPKYLRDRT